MDGAVHGVAKSWTRLTDFTSIHLLCLCLDLDSCVSSSGSLQRRAPAQPLKQVKWAWRVLHEQINRLTQTSPGQRDFLIL